MPSQVPNKLWPDFPFPSIVGNTMGIEKSSIYSGTYVPIEPGTPFAPKNHTVADAAQFSGMIFLRQNAGENNEFQRQAWATPPTLQDLYNYEIDFSAEDAGYPIFKRSYLVLRDGYSALGDGTLFSGVYAVKVTAAGLGYTSGGIVTFTGGGGTGASGVLVVDPVTGAIVKITLKSEGVGYTSAPTAVLPAGGAGGTAVGVVQATNCFLVSEKVVRTPDKDWDSIYFIAQRTYETLPGPWLYDTSLAEDSDVVTTKKRHNIISNITPGESIAGGQLIKVTSKAITDYVSWEIVETRALPGLVLVDYDQEPETLALITTEFQIVANPVSAPAPTPGTLIKVKHIDEFNSWIITEIRATPSGWTYQENAAFSFPSLFDYTQYIWTDACGAFSTERAKFSCNVQMVVVRSYTSTVQLFTGLQLIPKTLELGKGANISAVLVDAGSFTYTGSCTGTVTFSASSPDYSTYIGTIQGTLQLVGGSSKKTKYGDFLNEKLYVLMI